MSHPAIYGKVKEAMLKGYKAGLTVNETAQLTGYSPRSIRNAAENQGLKLASVRRRWGSVKDAVAERAHLPAREIIKQTGISRYSVYYAARRLGIKLPSPCTASSRS